MRPGPRRSTVPPHELAFCERAGLGVDDAGQLHPVHYGDDQRTIQRLGWKSAASTIARRNAGKAVIRSVKRMSTLPTTPAKKSAVTPISGSDCDGDARSRRTRRSARCCRQRGAATRRSRPRRSVPRRKWPPGGSGAPRGQAVEELRRGIIGCDQRRKHRRRDDHNYDYEPEEGERPSDDIGNDSTHPPPRGSRRDRSAFWHCGQCHAVMNPLIIARSGGPGPGRPH